MRGKRKRGTPGRFILAAIVAGVLVLSGCVTVPEMDTPAGFARFQNEDLPAAISPDGVVLRLRTTENDPPQTLEFWAKALGRQMSDSGYVLVGEGSFDAPAGAGTFFEWLAPVGDEDWIYLTAICVTGEQILIAEAAGRFDLYQLRRDSVIASLSTLQAESEDG